MFNCIACLFSSLLIDGRCKTLFVCISEYFEMTHQHEDSQSPPGRWYENIWDEKFSDNDPTLSDQSQPSPSLLANIKSSTPYFFPSCTETEEQSDITTECCEDDLAIAKQHVDEEYENLVLKRIQSSEPVPDDIKYGPFPLSNNKAGQPRVYNLILPPSILLHLKEVRRLAEERRQRKENFLKFFICPVLVVGIFAIVYANV